MLGQLQDKIGFQDAKNTKKHVQSRSKLGREIDQRSIKKRCKRTVQIRCARNQFRPAQWVVKLASQVTTSLAHLAKAKWAK